MSAGFVLVAVLLTLGCAAAVALPLVWRRGASGDATSAPAPAGAPVAAVAIAVLLAGGGAALYATWSNWSWPAPQAAGSSPTAASACR